MKKADYAWSLVNFIAILLLLTIGVYIVVRAYLLSMTHDEALTILSQGSQSYLNILLYNKGIRANNHLINSLLVRFVIGIVGYKDFFIRLAGLLGGCVYIFGAYKLSQKLFSGTWLFILSLVLLILNPYVLDFFSLARGYSLSSGFLIVSLLYFFNSYDSIGPEEALRYRIKSFVLMSFAVISNLSFLNVYVALIGTYFTIEFIVTYSTTEKNLSSKVLNDNVKKDLLHIFIITLGLFALIFLPLLKMAIKKQFYGGSTGFWHDTVTSLIQSSLYGKEYFNSYSVFNVFIVIIGFLFCINFAIKFYKKDPLNSSDKQLIIISSIIIMTALSIIFQNILFGTPFVTSRTAIYFIPLFTLFIFILWKSILNNALFRLRFIPNIALSFCGIISLFHYISCINLSYTYDWRYDASTKTAMHRIFAMEKDIKPGKDQITIGATWWLVPAVDYYLLQHGGQYKLVEPKGPYTLGPDGLYDYYYICECDKKILTKYHITLLDHYALSNTYLGVSSFLKQNRAKNKT